ncbi:RNA-dependent ATPase [Irineochytrium annulatum]|nr:RNA-dependent ATPase [Irineochytrium annulatum]
MAKKGKPVVKDVDAEDVAVEVDVIAPVKKSKKEKKAAKAADEMKVEVVADKEKKSKKRSNLAEEGEDVDAAAVEEAPKRAKKAKVAKAEEPAADAETQEPKPKKKKKKATQDGDGDRIMAIANEVANHADPESAPKAKIWSYTEHEDLTRMPQSDIDAFLSKNGITVVNASKDRPVLEFDQARFPQELKRALSTFARPTPIQSVSWAPCFNGRDLIGIAATGSGKTLAFGVPAILYIRNKLAQANVARGASTKHRVRALIMSPTRELAMQIEKNLEEFGKAMGVTSLCLYGGEKKPIQRTALRNGPDIIVATPGRLLDFVDEGECDLSDVGFFVLDEADRMLDLGFQPDIEKIVAAIKTTDRQTVMFSATWPQSVRKLAERYLRDPAHITVGSTDLSANVSIRQIVEVLDDRSKDSRLLQLLKEYHKNRKNRIMIFALYKKEAARLEGFVRRNGFNCACIQGDLSQDKRTEAINAFKDGSCPLLIATDVAARGIDVPDVEYVINYTYPLTTEDYCHRIGRTGRAGKKGIAHTFFTQNEKSHSGSLINVLKQAKQDVPDALMAFGTTVKKKLDPTYGAFTREIDPNAKPTKISFGEDDD